MKYKTKLYFLFIGLILLTTLCSTILVYQEVYRILFNDLQSDVKTVAITGSKLIDPEYLKEIHSKADIGTLPYKETVKTLREIRDINRRKKIYVTYIYIIRADGNDLSVVVDPTEDRAIRAYPGESYPEGVQIGVLNHLDSLWGPDRLVKDRWGEFLPAYAPILDKEGNYVATLGVNLSSHFVEDDLGRLKFIVFSMLGLSILISFFAASFLANVISRSLENIVGCVNQIGKGDLKTRSNLKTNDEFGQLAEAINNMAEGLEEHERLKSNFVRYVSKHVMERILKADKAPTIAGEEKQITVLFTDIRDFSKLAQKLDPEEVVSKLNEYLDKMLNVIFANEGTLDKFLGDGLMVEFGAPLEDPDQEKKAIKTALDLQKALEELNQKWRSENKAELQMGIGIHTGPAVVGNIGSEKRMEYTAIGNTVNIASRLEHATKNLKVPIIISQTTADKIKDSYRLKELGPIEIEGWEEKMQVFTIESQ